MAKKVINEDNDYLNHLCGECAKCEPYMRFETLSVHGRKPTMGICPLSEFKVLLSERACKNFKMKKI